MNVLVTGATGNLGKAVIAELSTRGISAVKYSHSQNLSEVVWDTVTHVVNCAAVIPKSGVAAKDYIDGNVVFLESLLMKCKGKVFISYSSFSELFRYDTYQHSKLLANSLVVINSHVFKKHHIVALPTLDDFELIERIKEKAYSGSLPVVDDLDYNYMSFEDVACYTVDKLLNWEEHVSISGRFQKKNLYREVCKSVEPGLIVKGNMIDRQLSREGVYHCCPTYLSTLI